jgi:hypothetical protein
MTNLRHSNHEDTSNNNNNNSSSSNFAVLYVVQRCWHSGPQQYQPLDCLRLFQTQRDAEEAAYHSAHAWSRHIHNGREVSIKTLLLPSYPTGSGSSYGFIASGTLFWVRALKATVVTARHHNRHMFPERNVCHTAVYAILTEGVIGGTGNRNSRRGTEVPEGRVFGGDASSHRAAMDAMAQIQAGFAAQGMMDPPKLELMTLPVGKPDEYATGNFLKCWPEQVLQPPTMIMDEDHHAHKRHSEEDFWEAQEEEGMVVDCPFEMPPSAKRRRTTASTGIGCENNNNSNSMFQGTGAGGLVVLRGGVFVGVSTGNYSPTAAATLTTTNNSCGTNDVAMM